MFASYNGRARPSSPIKGTRKVFDNAMVAHVWAQQTQSEGRSANGNFYFRDSTIYSYGAHFPIARFSKDKSVVWFTTRGYSVSTSGHVRYTNAALRGLPLTIVPLEGVEIDRFDESRVSSKDRAAIELRLMRMGNEEAWNAFQRVTGKPSRKWPEDYRAKVDAVDAKAKATILKTKLEDARKNIENLSRGVADSGSTIVPIISNETAPEYPTPYYTAQNNARECERYRSRMGKARAALSSQASKSKADKTRISTASGLMDHFAVLRDTWANIVKAMDSSQNEERDHNEIANALRNIESGAERKYWYEDGVGTNKTTETEILSARIKRALQIGFTVEQIAPLLRILQGRLFYRETDNATEESIRIVYSRRYDAKDRVTPESWQNGKGHAAQYSIAATLVRRKGDTLETSRGATCPFAHAVIAFRKAQECRAAGTSWHRNGQTIRVGHFQVDSIDASGNMKAGCHTLEWAEMLRLAILEVPHMVKPSFGLPVVLGA